MKTPLTTTRMFFGLLLGIVGLISLVEWYVPGVVLPEHEGRSWVWLLILACFSYGLALLLTRPE